jgi:hypothetical protein
VPVSKQKQAATLTLLQSQTSNEEHHPHSTSMSAAFQHMPTISAERLPPLASSLTLAGKSRPCHKSSSKATLHNDARALADQQILDISQVSKNMLTIGYAGRPTS